LIIPVLIIPDLIIPELMMKALGVLIAAITFGLGAGDAAAKSRPFRASDYPLEVRKTLSLGPVTCREVEGGGKVGFARDTVRKVDFNGDGIKDHIVNFENTTCGGAKTGGFCGSGGCMVDFLVTLPNGKIRSVFADQIHGYQILRGHPRKVRFWIFHGYCPHRSDGCPKDVRIGYRLFTPIR
jgi:hypothetical protein